MRSGAPRIRIDEPDHAGPSGRDCSRVTTRNLAGQSTRVEINLVNGTQLPVTSRLAARRVAASASRDRGIKGADHTVRVATDGAMLAARRDGCHAASWPTVQSVTTPARTYERASRGSP